MMPALSMSGANATTAAPPAESTPTPQRLGPPVGSTATVHYSEIYPDLELPDPVPLHAGELPEGFNPNAGISGDQRGEELIEMARERLGDRFGGGWFENPVAEPSVLRIGVVSLNDNDTKWLEEAAGDYRDSVATAAATHSEAELYRLKNEVVALLATQGNRFSIEHDVAGNRLIVSGSRSLGAAVRRAFEGRPVEFRTDPHVGMVSLHNNRFNWLKNVPGVGTVPFYEAGLAVLTV